jgi:Tol biopolymer transport system component
MLARVAWSPDDTTLAFMRSVDSVPQIFTIVIGQSAPKQRTHSKASKDDPAWSPDGKTAGLVLRRGYRLPVRGCGLCRSGSSRTPNRS